MQTQPDEIVNMCFQRSKKLHLDSDITEQEESKIDSTSINVEPIESDKENFLNHVMKLMPTSAALTAVVVKQTSDSEPIATNARVALKLPPTLASLYDPKYKNLSQSDFQEACESVFKNLTVSVDEAKYLEESTRLQSQSTLWFNH